MYGFVNIYNFKKCLVQNTLWVLVMTGWRLQTAEEMKQVVAVLSL